VCISPLPQTCHVLRSSQSSWLDHPINIWYLQIISSSFCSLLHSPVTSTQLWPNLHRNLFSNTLNLCSSFSLRDQVSQPYKTTGIIVVLRILISKSLDSKLKDKIFRRIITNIHLVQFAFNWTSLIAAFNPDIPRYRQSVSVRWNGSFDFRIWDIRF
jgi:hypothetical protein